MSVEKITEWLIRDDFPFAYSLRNLELMEAGMRICKRYGIEIAGMSFASDDEATAYIYEQLEKLNG